MTGRQAAQRSRKRERNRSQQKSPDRSQGFSIGGLKRNRTAVNGFAIHRNTLFLKDIHENDTQLATRQA